MRRALVIGAAVVVLAAAAAGYWYFFAQQTQGPRTSVHGTLVAATHQELQLRLSDGSTATYTVTEQTPVYSHIKEGETAKVLSQFAPSTFITLLLDHTTNTVLQVNAAPPPILPAQYGSSVFGTIQEIGSGSFTIALAQTDLPRAYAVSSATEIISLALAGEVGKGVEQLEIGMRISVFGQEEATLIIVLPPEGPPEE